MEKVERWLVGWKRSYLSKGARLTLVKFKAKAIWNLVLEKVERWLVGWKCSYLLKGARLTLIKNVSLKVDDGSRTRFWTDVWCGAVSLKDSFPELYRITWVKDAFVANHLQFCNDFVHWELDFVRLVQDWDLESLSNFLDLLYLVSVKGHGEDLLWLAGVV